jgi:hypothetical protein
MVFFLNFNGFLNVWLSNLKYAWLWEISGCSEIYHLSIHWLFASFERVCLIILLRGSFLRHLDVLVEVLKLVMVDIVPIDQITLFSLDLRVRNPPNRVHLRLLLLGQNTIVCSDILSLTSLNSPPPPLHEPISILFLNLAYSISLIFSHWIFLILTWTLVKQLYQIFAPLKLCLHQWPLLNRQRITLIFAILDDFILLLHYLLSQEHLLWHPLELDPNVDFHAFFRQLALVVYQMVYWDQVRGQIWGLGTGVLNKFNLLFIKVQLNIL